LDEGIIQAYIDGELPREQAAASALHLAACEACSAARAAAEGETSFFANAFAPDDSLSVPTAALRARVNAAVAQLEASAESNQQHSQGWSFGGFLASLPGLFNFTPRTAAAFATLLVAVAAGIIYFSSQKSQQTPAAGSEVVRATETPAPAVKTTPENSEFINNAPVSIPTPAQVDKKPSYVAAGYGKRLVKRQPAAAPRAPKAEALPGEKEYQTAIASLEKTIKLGGDESLRPALRADYERNIALLDSAISQTRQVAAQNPKDKDAVSFLMSAYQSKVELLTRVADQAQVAALGR
jgi:anti-sigma factor RsiW